MGTGLSLRIAGAAAAMLVIVGAYGSWGKLSTDSFQAEIVDGTRDVLAGLAGLALATLVVPRARHLVSVLCAVLALIIGIFAYGDLHYEGSFHNRDRAPEASLWGLMAVLAGAAILFLAASAEVVVETKRRMTPPAPNSLSQDP